MSEEVDRHQLIRNSLEHELQAMRERLTTFDNFHAVVDSFNKNAGHTEDQISRLTSLCFSVTNSILLFLLFSQDV